MDVVRKYKWNDWWDFLIVIDQELDRKPTSQTYLDLLDELYWRRVECISEGGLFKLRAPALKIYERLLTEIESNSSFCSAQFKIDCLQVYENIIK